MLEPLIGDKVKTRINGKACWAKITGNHNGDAYQGIVGIAPEGEDILIGAAISIPRDKIESILTEQDHDTGG